MILHVDGDGFFASCEQVMHPELRGKPVVTGSERGVITSASKEAKVLGIGRGVTPREAKKICPRLIFVNSNYRAYELFSYRMISIVRRYAAAVEHYSIDEAFADLDHNDSIAALAWWIKQDIQSSLGLTVSLGVAPTKTLAKVASRWKKPDGFTVIAPGEHEPFLRDCPLEKIWGIGPQTAKRLHGLGLATALDFIRLPPAVLLADFARPFRCIYEELRGVSLLPVEADLADDPKSMRRTHTFRPTTDLGTIEQELLFNLEQVFRRARAAGLGSRRVAVMIKSQTFRYYSQEFILARPTAYEGELVAQVRTALRRLVRPGWLYRATGVFLSDLEPLKPDQAILFDPPAKLERLERLYASLDELRARFKQPVVRVGPVRLPTQRRSIIETLPSRTLLPVPPENRRSTRLKFL